MPFMPAMVTTFSIFKLKNDENICKKGLDIVKNNGIIISVSVLGTVFDVFAAVLE